MSFLSIRHRLATLISPELRWFIALVVAPMIMAGVLFSFWFSRSKSPYLYIPFFDRLWYPDSTIIPFVPRAIVFGLMTGKPFAPVLVTPKKKSSRSSSIL